MVDPEAFESFGHHGPPLQPRPLQILRGNHSEPSNLAQSSNRLSAIAMAVLAAALPLFQLPASTSAFAQTAAAASRDRSTRMDNGIPATQADKLGRQTFVSSCALCHGLDGRGGEHAPNIATNPKVQQLSDGELFQIIENGIPAGGMPGFQSLGPSTLKTVVAYLRILQGKHSAAALPGNPERGRQLFFGKAACSSKRKAAGLVQDFPEGPQQNASLEGCVNRQPRFLASKDPGIENQACRPPECHFQ